MIIVWKRFHISIKKKSYIFLKKYGNDSIKERGEIKNEKQT